VYPALAIVAALAPKADVLWVGGEGGMEASLVSRSGIAFESIPAAGLHGVGPRALPGNLWRLASGIPAAAAIVRRFKPNVLLLTGGFVGVPVALAARRVPTVVYVPDIEPGQALRWLSRNARVVAVTAEASRRFYARRANVLVSGYPARPGLGALDRLEARRRLGLAADKPVLLVFGGSRGARSINQAVWHRLEELLDLAQVVHVTGERDWPDLVPATKSLSPDLSSRYHAYAYLHEEMAWALAAADLAVSRAGASVLGEFPIVGLPAVLVPYPHAWRYQKVNAEYLSSRGAAVSLPDDAIESELAPTVLGLLSDPRKLATMSDAMRRLARPEAAGTIAAEIIRLAQEDGPTHG
jgi:UDP-N-acetylglucosamine:LPS N-acetylglucosamine transferase